MKNKGEKGAITLFITLSCFFIIIMLMVYMMNMENKKQAQNKEIEQITKSYEVNEQKMEEAYTKAVNNF